MTRIDRYILLLYLRVLVICFASVAGLLVVVQVFTNLDEFSRFAMHSGQGLLAVLLDYFTPYVIAVFERLSGMLALLAMLFVIAWLNKTHEFTALLASGIPKRRIIKPLLAASLVVIVSAVVTREFVIPQYQDQLDEKPQDLTGELPRDLRPTYDANSMVLFQGRHLLPIKSEIVEPSLRVQGGPLINAVGSKLLAGRAHYERQTREHPAGFRLIQVQQPKQIDQLDTVFGADGESPLLYTSKQSSWLAAGECFLVSDIEYEMLRGGSVWKQYASTRELITHLRGENAQRSHDVRVQIHQRLLRPLSDWTVLLLGIPVLLTRPDRHMFWVAGACLGVVAGFTAVAIGCAAVGSSGQLISPSLSVWLPLLLFLPWAWAKTCRALES